MVFSPRPPLRRLPLRSGLRWRRSARPGTAGLQQYFLPRSCPGDVARGGIRLRNRGATDVVFGGCHRVAPGLQVVQKWRVTNGNEVEKAVHHQGTRTNARRVRMGDPRLGSAARIAGHQDRQSKPVRPRPGARVAGRRRRSPERRGLDRHTCQSGRVRDGNTSTRRFWWLCDREGSIRGWS